jgi:hypothetical protein
VAHSGQGVIFGIEGYGTPAVSLFVGYFEGGFDAVCVTSDFVVIVQGFEEGADVVVGVEFFEC